MNEQAFEFTCSAQALREIISESAATGAIIALVAAGSLKPYIKKSEAYRQFGRYRVDKWIANGMVTIRKDGNHSAAWRIDRLEIEAQASAEKLCMWL